MSAFVSAVIVAAGENGNCRQQAVYSAFVTTCN